MSRSKVRIVASIFLLVLVAAADVDADADVQCFVDGECVNGQLLESVRNVDEVRLSYVKIFWRCKIVTVEWFSSRVFCSFRCNGIKTIMLSASPLH